MAVQFKEETAFFRRATRSIHMKTVLSLVIAMALGASGLCAETEIRGDVLYLGAGPRAEALATEIRTVYKFSQPLDLSDTREFPKKVHAKVISQPEPVFPDSPERKPFHAMVTAVFIVDDKGDVSEAAVMGCSDPYVQKCVVEAVLSWKFEPAKRGDTPVRMLMRLPLTVNIRE